MTTIEIPEKKLTAQIPSSWAELTTPQFECIMQNWIKVIDGYINQHEFKLTVLYNLLGINRGPFDTAREARMSPEKLELKYENLWRLTREIEWLFDYRSEAGKKTVSLSYFEVTNRFPQIEINETLFTGPADGMLNISFGEYRHAYIHFETYLNTRQDKELNLLVATLYRPERQGYLTLMTQPAFDGQRSEPFNPNITPLYAHMIDEIPFWQKYAILLWFINCDRMIKEDELTLGGKPVSFSPLFRKQTNEDEVETLDDTDLGLTQLLFAVSESKLFGTPDQVDRTGYIDVLTALLYWKMQNDKLKK